MTHDFGLPRVRRTGKQVETCWLSLGPVVDSLHWQDAHLTRCKNDMRTRLTQDDTGRVLQDDQFLRFAFTRCVPEGLHTADFHAWPNSFHRST